jgi:RimJ/RimL family protein N-acetyltransferase
MPDKIAVREMVPGEAHLVADYFNQATPEFLEILGVDPTRLGGLNGLQDRLQTERMLALDERRVIQLVWLGDDRPIGFSNCDKIVFAERANMHLHVIDPELRQRGIGTECVRRSVRIYFELLRLRELFCEPNAFNTAPNRTIQKAGFKYVKTYTTVPGPLNFHQAVTRWVIRREDISNLD